MSLYASTTRDHLERIAMLARACRDAQRRYFESRDGRSLAIAKDAERRLNEALKDTGPKQQTLGIV